MCESTESLRKKVAADYDAIADEWDRTRGHGRSAWGEFSFLENEIQRYIALDRTGERQFPPICGERELRILDAGCGNGRLVHFLDGVLPDYDYLGVDVSTKLLEKARTNAPTRTFEYADLTTFRSSATFDIVACIAVVHHLSSTDALSMLRHLRAALAPSGVLFLTAWNLWQPRYIGSILKSYLTREPRACSIPFAGRVDRYVHAFTPSDLASLLRAAGFTHVDAFFTAGDKHATFWIGRNITAIARV